MPKIIKLKENEIVAFNDENADWGIFSNNALTPIKMQTPHGEKTFPTATHYYQYMKNPDDLTYLEAILACATASETVTYFNSHLTSWLQEGGADKAANAAVTAKIEQHQSVKTALMQTENACLIFDTGSNPDLQDGTWGYRSGGKKTDLATVPPALPPGNKLGILWMQKRNEIFKAIDKNDWVIEDPAALSETVRVNMESNLPATYLLDPAANLPSREAVAPNSVITRSVTASTDEETAAAPFNEPDRISALLIELNKDGGRWSVDAAKSTADGDQHLTDGTHNLIVGTDTITTPDADLVTFRTALKAFAFLCPGDKPKITVNSAMLKNLWKKACAELSVEAEIVLVVPTPAPASTNTEGEQATQEETPSPTPSPA